MEERSNMKTWGNNAWLKCTRQLKTKMRQKIGQLKCTYLADDGRRRHQGHTPTRRQIGASCMMDNMNKGREKPNLNVDTGCVFARERAINFRLTKIMTVLLQDSSSFCLTIITKMPRSCILRRF